MTKTDRIEGDFEIVQRVGFFIGKIKLKDTDGVHLPIKKLRRIIKDAEKGKLKGV